MALLDAYHLVSIPGNPTETEYELQCVPDCPYPFISGIGAVLGTEVLADDVTQAFSVIVSDYVHDGTKSSTVQYDCSINQLFVCYALPFRCTFNSSRP